MPEERKELTEEEHKVFHKHMQELINKLSVVCRDTPMTWSDCVFALGATANVMAQVAGTLSQTMSVDACKLEGISALMQAYFAGFTTVEIVTATH